MSSQSNNSPFAARSSTRPAAPVSTVSPAVAASGSSRKNTPAIIAVLAGALLLAGAAAWWLTRSGAAEPASVSPAAVAPEKPATPVEAPAEKAARLSKAFAAVQARGAGLSLDDTARATLADATLLAGQAQGRVEAGDAAGAAREWEKALAGAGPVVFAAVGALYDAETASLRDLRLEDQAAPAVQALARALAAADESARRGDWADAIVRRDEARGLAPAAAKAVAVQFAEAARSAATRGDAAMAALFHGRALRIDGELGSSREYLYRHKYSAGQVIRSPGGLELVYAPPAEFSRGSPSGEPGRDADETPQRVILTKGFFVAVNETTQRDWDRVMGAGSAMKILRAAKAKAETISPDLPMHSVTWSQAAEYCRKLSAQEGMGFRLPTEAEWEYACRAGTTTAFNLGADGLSARDANIDDGTSAAPLAPRAPGASGRANAWGLRDMHGNVWEWCADWSAPYPPSTAALRDPEGPASDRLGRLDLALKVVRGGGWNAPANDARSANRWEYAPDVATAYIGLRVVHDPDLTK